MSPGESVYGKVIHDAVDHVIRVRSENGYIKVSVHQKVGGREQIPKGYMLGSTMLIWRKIPGSE
jgi:hypothetical protein